MINKYITLHPQYFLKEGFGTLMSHYAVMYSLYKDLGVTPIILDINFQDKKLTSSMEVFNNFSEEIIYHHEAFVNFSNIFSIINETDINSYNWVFKNFSNLTYDQLAVNIQLENNNIICIWSLTPELTNRYLDDIINNLFIFNNDIITISSNNLPKTDKDIIGVCVRNEYKKSNYPHTQLSLNFYIEAMKNYDINNSKYLIFSDDIEESKKMFNKLENTFDISYTQQMQSAMGMCTMSMCDHVICANSSFSYWASLLNKNTNKKIVCSKYFIDKNKNLFLANLLNHKWYHKSWTSLDII
jgi:hypothetical protein